jgi:malonate-semialdehyde dehydrogenase (acetylating)/methylmalonate-semialdehyde dehydrogenase
MLIMPDCNLDSTIAAMMTSFYGNAGQRCLSGANAVVIGKDDDFYKRFVNAFYDAATKIRVGYGLDNAVQMGPMQSPDGKTRVLGFIEKGIQEGAKLLLDGRTFQLQGDYPDTCFLGPSIFENVDPGMTIAREEIFGPVANILRADDLDAAIDMVNGSRYGNAVAVFTSSGKAARELRYRAQCGNIGINIGIVAPMAFFPFSGMKDSFFGTLHGQGRDAIRFFTESKIVIERWF